MNINAPRLEDRLDKVSKGYLNFKTEQYFPSPNALISCSAISNSFLRCLLAATGTDADLLRLELRRVPLAALASFALRFL
jgi:shikimate kinase